MSWLAGLSQASLFSPDMLANDAVRGALIAGTVVAVISAGLGYFVVLRGLSFAGHAITDIGFTGGAGATLIGLNPLWGLMLCCCVAGVGIELLGNRVRERDVATGVILALSFGLGALFLYASTRFANAPFSLLFGSIFTIDPSIIPAMTVIGLACLATLAIAYRPLLFCSVSPETAAARGVRVRLVGILFMVSMAIGVAETAQVVGVLLSTALLVGPAATASYLTARPGIAIAIGAALALLETWLGIALAYDSYSWPPGGKGWPVSFFITMLALAAYLLARLLRPVERRLAWERRVSVMPGQPGDAAA